MFLLSYRGPASGGGISSSLGALWNHPANDVFAWWHMSDGGLLYSMGAARPALMENIDPELIAGHYRFCNRFIWPLMHGIEQHIQYGQDDFADYVLLQDKVAKTIAKKTDRHLFMHDYQFSLLPSYFDESSFFWHIPWPHPDEVSAKWHPFLEHLAAKIACAQKIGFHTRQYAQNFLSCLTGFDKRHVKHNVMVAPVPIDFELWKARCSEPHVSDQALDVFNQPNVRFVLSIDRADYTKGILERLRTIDVLFKTRRDLRGKLVFVQLCQRTRNGIADFDHYWRDARQLFFEVNQRWGNESWSPIVWVEKSFSGNELAHIYKRADVLMVSSIKDGLNLTAKEYIACQDNSAADSAVVVSKHAGVSEQLHPYCFSLDPRDIAEAARLLSHALSCSRAERRVRMQGLKEIVAKDDLLAWSRCFGFDHSSVLRHEGNTRNGA